MSECSTAAHEYANSVCGLRLDILFLEQLAAWSPRGTISFDYAVRDAKYDDAVRAVRRAGSRVRPVEVEPWRGDVGVGFSAFTHLGAPTHPESCNLNRATRYLLLFEELAYKIPQDSVAGLPSTAEHLNIDD